MPEKNKCLCKWKTGQIQKQLNGLSEIVSGSRYICTRCARAARDKKWLCRPEKLPK